jgi:hypothetical protein
MRPRKYRPRVQRLYRYSRGDYIAAWIRVMHDARIERAWIDSILTGAGFHF